MPQDSYFVQNAEVLTSIGQEKIEAILVEAGGKGVVLVLADLAQKRKHENPSRT